MRISDWSSDVLLFRSEHIGDVSLTLEKGSLNVLLGPTLSGKTSLMRLMAGLDRPTEGDILLDGASVVGVPVQKRNVAMVYQQFINYPTLTVYENIAPPLRVAGADQATIERRISEERRVGKERVGTCRTRVAVMSKNKRKDYNKIRY